MVTESENVGRFYIQNRKNTEIKYQNKNKNSLVNDADNTRGSINRMKEDMTQLSSGITGIEGFKGGLNEITDDGPVARENMEDFTELKKLQTKFNRHLQEYNKAIQTLAENSKNYITASNSNNNKFANTFIRDPNGAVGYVTQRGVWKWLPNPTMANSMQGKNGCPSGWSNAPTVSADDGQQYSSIWNAPQGETVKTGGATLIRGTSTILNQSCGSAGQNIYITNPSKTTNRQYIQCSQNPGSYQEDLGSTTLEACAKRAEDMGSNVFQLGPNNGNGTGNCYVGGGGSPLSDQLCPNVPGVGNMGVVQPGSWQQTGQSWWWSWNYSWIPGYNGFATYQTEGANNANLGDTYHITDDLRRKKYPWYLAFSYGNEFQLLSGYNSYGNDIVSGSGLTVEQVKKKCLETPGAAGFYINGNNYWIKNANMWPNGNRQFTGGDLYLRNTSVTNSNSCSKQVNFSQQTELNGYVNDGDMTENTTCALGTISHRDRVLINERYTQLNEILDEIHQKIIELSQEDLALNKKLLDEYNLLKRRLNTYEITYKEIQGRTKTISHYTALEDDSNLQMLSYNQKYILWSMLALGVTAGAMKIMK